MSVGWGWTQTEFENNHDNLITMNHVYNADGILTDGGGVCTLSAQRGTGISSNNIHDILAGQTGLNFHVFSNGVCPSGTTTAAGVRPQAAAATKFVRFSDILPIVTELLNSK